MGSGRLSRNYLAIGALTATMVAIVLGGSGRFYATWSNGSGQEGPLNRVEQIRRDHLPDTRLTDHNGRAVRFYDDLVRGKVVAISFMYAACNRICELASQNMGRLQDELGERLGSKVSLYSISVDPENDTADDLRIYRDRHGARPGWSFFTAASVAEVTDLRRKLGVYDPDPSLDGNLSNHTGMLVLGNEATGRWTMIPSLVHPIRIRQALERVILPPELWPSGDAVIQEVPRELSTASESR